MATGNRYNFSSVGSAMTDALTQQMLENEARKQQEFINNLKLREQALQEAQEKRQAEYQQQLFKDQVFNRESQRADRIYEDLLAGVPVDEATASLLEKHGRGGVLERGGALGQVGEARMNPDQINVNLSGTNLTPSQMAELDSALTGSVDDLNPTQTKRTVAPGVIVSRGGSKWQAARQAAEERAAQAKIAAQSREDIARENREAANQRAREMADVRRDIANLAAQGKRSGDLTDVQFRRAQQLEADYTRDSKDYIERTNSYRTILSAAQNQSAAGDLSIIFAYMKMLDPGSVVREGEFATAQNSAGVPDRIRNTYNKIISGERLAPAQRQDFINQASNIFKGARKGQEATKTRYTKLAQGAGVPVEFVIGNYGDDLSVPQESPNPMQPVPSHQSTGGSKIKSIKRIN